MKSFVAVAAFIALAAAAPGAEVTTYWGDNDYTKTTTTTTKAKPTSKDPHNTWEDYSTTTTTKAKPTSKDPHNTWEDYTSTTTKKVDPTTTGTWGDYDPSKPTTTTTATWGDYAPTVTITVTDKVTTYCAKPTTFVDKWETYTCTEGETKALTKGPYTITIPVSYETSTVCEGKPAAPTPEAGKPGKPESPASTTPAVYKPTPVSPDTKPSQYTGAATKMTGAGLAGVAAIAALLL